MQLPKEEYARKRIHNGSSVQIENSVTRATVRHHSASVVMPNSYPCDGIFNQHLTTIKDSYVTKYKKKKKLCDNKSFKYKLTKNARPFSPWTSDRFSQMQLYREVEFAFHVHGPQR